MVFGVGKVAAPTYIEPQSCWQTQRSLVTNGLCVFVVCDQTATWSTYVLVAQVMRGSARVGTTKTASASSSVISARLSQDTHIDLCTLSVDFNNGRAFAWVYSVLGEVRPSRATGTDSYISSS